MEYREEDKEFYYELGLKCKKEEKWQEALDNLLIAKHIFEMNTECNKAICDIMIHNCTYVALIPYLKDYIKSDPGSDIKYSLLYGFIKIMIAHRDKEMHTVDINEYLNLDSQLEIFCLQELIDSINKKDLERFTKYTMFVDSIYDMDDDLVSVLLCLKTELWFQILCDKEGPQV